MAGKSIPHPPQRPRMVFPRCSSGGVDPGIESKVTRKLLFSKANQIGGTCLATELKPLKDTILTDTRLTSLAHQQLHEPLALFQLKERRN